MPFYRGKDGFYQEKTEILSRKRGFLEKNLYKCRFTVEKMLFIMKNRNFISKTNFSKKKNRNSVLHWKRWFFS